MSLEYVDQLVHVTTEQASDNERLRNELDEAWIHVAELMNECKTVGLLLAEAQERLRNLASRAER